MFDPASGWRAAHAGTIIADVDLLSARRWSVWMYCWIKSMFKTGCGAPDPQFARQLRQRWPQRFACAGRCVPNSGWRRRRCGLICSKISMVAMTGSKFIGGPSFSSAY